MIFFKKILSIGQLIPLIDFNFLNRLFFIPYVLKSSKFIQLQ